MFQRHMVRFKIEYCNIHQHPYHRTLKVKQWHKENAKQTLAHAWMVDAKSTFEQETNYDWKSCIQRTMDQTNNQDHSSWSLFMILDMI